MSIITEKYGTLEYLTAQGISVPHCFTTRLGGVSTGHLASLNIGIHRGDTPENVLKNYKILCGALGTDPHRLVLSTQTHSDIVRAVGSGDCGAGLFTPELPECDALITDTPGVGLVIFTADCTPILLHDPVTGAVGAVHAGWRGTASAIVSKAVKAMQEQFGCRPENIRAAIGPNLSVCCFETDGDVPEAMRRILGTEAEPYILQTGEKFHVDLKGINALHLKKMGVSHIEISEACTMCQSDRFWSHRATKGLRGSQGAVIVCGRD